MIEIEISDNQSHLTVDRAFVESVARTTLESEKVTQAQVSFAFVDDATIHEINRRHLDHDWPTDVITFGLSEPDDPLLAAELVISTEMTVRTAEESGVEPRTELALYVVHGLLHLCGFDDHEPDDIDAMRRREGEVLLALGLSHPFHQIEPVAPTGEVRGSQPWER